MSGNDNFDAERSLAERQRQYLEEQHRRLIEQRLRDEEAMRIDSQAELQRQRDMETRNNCLQFVGKPCRWCTCQQYHLPHFGPKYPSQCRNCPHQAIEHN